MKGKELYKKYEDEKEKHEENKEQEKERHEKVIENIQEKSGLTKIQDIEEDISNIVDDIGSTKKGTKKIFYKSLNALMGRKRTCIGNSITIRDGKVYRYGCQHTVSIHQILLDYKGILREIKDDDRRETAKKVMDTFKDFPEWEEYNRQTSIRMEKDFPEEKVDTIEGEPKKLTFKAGSYPTLKIEVKKDEANICAFDKFEFSRLGGFRENPEIAFTLSEEMIEGAKEIREKTKKRLEKRRKAVEKIKKTASKYLVVEAL